VLAGDLARAEREIRADYEFLKKAGETFYLSTLEGMLSLIVRDQGRDEEALAMTRAVEAAAAMDDVDAQVQWRAVRAPILARRGDVPGGEAMARAAIELARTTDDLALQADTLCELAEVLRLAGRGDEARQSMAEAAALCLAKGNIVSTRRAQAWIAAQATE